VQAGSRHGSVPEAALSVKDLPGIGQELRGLPDGGGTSDITGHVIARRNVRALTPDRVARQERFTPH